jgi:hypothetical protein
MTANEMSFLSNYVTAGQKHPALSMLYEQLFNNFVTAL